MEVYPFQNANVDPESVLLAAFAAVANNDAETLTRLLDPESLDNVREIHRQSLEAAWEAVKAEAIVPAEYDFLCGSIGVRSATDLEKIDDSEMVARLISGLPAARTEIGCNVVGHVNETDNIVHVLFRLTFDSQPSIDDTLRTATFRRLNNRWGLVFGPLNSWVLPGMEGVFFPSESGPPL